MNLARFAHDRPGTPADRWATADEWAGVPELDTLGARPDRVVVAAAHPDDESLGAGGLIARLTRVGVPVSLVLATAGERSHPRSPTTPPEVLAARRRFEADQAWATLGGRPDHLGFWGLPDGELAAHHDELVDRLVAEVGDGRATMVITPWRHDGHPDHDALGRAGAVAAFRTAATLWQYPVWFWHRAHPRDAPWPQLAQVRLTPQEMEVKAAAVDRHRSQVAPLSVAPGDETLLGRDLLAHFAGQREAFVREPADDDALDALHADSPDPWGTRSRWYEERKRALTLSLLPRRRFDRALDVGCSAGTLTRALAPRCDQLLAVDRSPRAIDAARATLADCSGVYVDVADVPRQWPDGPFDLVVVSESAYFLSPLALDQLIDRVSAALTPDGCLLLAHWRHPMAGWPLDGPTVHTRFAASDRVPPVIARYRDRDVEIVVHGPADALPRPGG